VYYKMLGMTRIFILQSKLCLTAFPTSFFDVLDDAETISRFQAPSTVFDRGSPSVNHFLLQAQLRRCRCRLMHG
jgi:hypothetical protein